MNKLEVFEKVKVHLLQQNARSIRSRYGAGALCAYRGDNGLSCAVGCLIKDEFYHPSLETKSVQAPEIIGALVASGIVERHALVSTNDPIIKLLFRLQRMHDSTAVADWSWELAAIEANLTTE